MKVAIIYIFPTVDVATYEPLARRFAQSYMDHPPGETEHELFVCSNGYPAGQRQRQLFEPLTCTHIQHNNTGKDIGAYQVCAENIPCDLLLCLGSSTKFWKAGWLDRIAQVYKDNGPALYGCWAFHQPAVHVRTTAFWLPPELLNSYPYRIADHMRYEFEHGQHSIVNHVTSVGFPSYMVTWSGVYGRDQWHHVERDQCLWFDNHCERIGYQ